MEHLIRYTQSELSKVTNHRSGEVKFGEKMILIPKGENVVNFLKNSEAKFVLFGIPEDIGVRANNGRAGASTAWDSAIKSIANIQHNRFCKGSNLIVLGTLDTTNFNEEAEGLQFNSTPDRKKFGEIVSKIDKEVSHIISTIVKCGKIPLIIGGGHNNAYGNIKGTALSKGKPINAINLDAHSDFRIMEGRHSGNGFSYAFEEGFLKKYFIFGLHESYTSKNVLDQLKSLKDKIQYNTYDAIKVRGEKEFRLEMQIAYDFIKTDPYGIEIDMDALPLVPSSAMTPSGFSVEEVRQFIYFFGKHSNAAYLHICEGAPALDTETNNHMVGKLIGYLLTDFIKAKNSLD
ncbi:MAG: hypothetical protein RL607_263 [Bacteroidota bacterium]|jgi:formiminoglutamase